MKWWQIAVATAIGLLALDAVASPGASFEDGGMRKMTIWRKLESIVNLTDTQRYFVMLVAYGEGGYNPTAHNGSGSERDAARRALERSPSIQALAASCGIPSAALESGSWGTFQRLAPYWAADIREILPGDCAWLDPSRATANLDLQIADAIHLARKLQNYQGWQAAPTVGNLRLGWANPSFMGYLTKHAERLDKYRRHAVKVGLPSGIVDRNIEVFPADARSIYYQLRGGS